MSSIFGMIWGGVRAVVDGLRAYVAGGLSASWDIVVYGWDTTKHLFGGSVAAFRRTWNADHGIRAVIGFTFGMLALPFALVSGIVGGVVVFGAAFVFVPMMIWVIIKWIGIGLALVAAPVVVALLFKGIAYLFNVKVEETVNGVLDA